MTDHTGGVIPGTTVVVTNAVPKREGGAAFRRDHLQNRVAVQNGRGRGNRPTLICVVVVGRRVHAWMLWTSARYKLVSEGGIMEATELEIPLLQLGEKVIGTAYLTLDGEIVFSPHSDAIWVVLVEPPAGVSGPWAVRLRPVPHSH